MAAKPDGIQSTPSLTARKAALGKADNVIETDHLGKIYGWTGKIEALKGLTLNVRRGEIFGLLGQNGAGKTTLIKILLGITKLTYGTATILGEPAGSVSVRRRIGYLPEDHRFPEYHTGASLLDFYGTLLEVPHATRVKRIDEMLELVGIKGRMHYKIRTYSKGMKQRLGIAQALMHEPEIIFLDEPTDGVDPVGRKEIRALLHRLKEEGKTIFINSHLLGEVELVCDRVIILQRGEVLREGDVATLLKQRGLYLIALAPNQIFPQAEVEQMGYVVRHDGEFWELTMQDNQTIDRVVDLLKARGLNLRHLAEKRQTLEDLFVQTVEAAEPGVDRPSHKRPTP